jgi:hypothetical protein
VAFRQSDRRERIGRRLVVLGEPSVRVRVYREVLRCVYGQNSVDLVRLRAPLVDSKRIPREFDPDAKLE